MHVTVGDVRLFFDVEGAKLIPDGPIMRERPTLLLLHGGYGADHTMLRPAFDRFADICQVVYVDQRGGGRSDRSTPDRWTLEVWADDVLGFCDALGIERPIVYGISFGSVIAMAYAARHPDHPDALILSSPTPTSRPAGILDAYERLGGPAAREAALSYRRRPSPETVAAFDRICRPLYNRTPQDPNAPRRQVAPNLDVARALFAPGNPWGEFDLRPALGQVRCPTLILGGEDDPATPIENQEAIAAALPAHLVRFERFPNAGHGPERDDPRAFDVIRAFILAQQASVT